MGNTELINVQMCFPYFSCWEQLVLLAVIKTGTTETRHTFCCFRLLSSAGLFNILNLFHLGFLLYFFLYFFFCLCCFFWSLDVLCNVLWIINVYNICIYLCLYVVTVCTLKTMITNQIPMTHLSEQILEDFWNCSRNRHTVPEKTEEEKKKMKESGWTCFLYTAITKVPGWIINNAMPGWLIIMCAAFWY